MSYSTANLRASSWFGSIAIYCELDPVEITTGTNARNNGVGRAVEVPSVIQQLQRVAYLPMIAHRCLSLHKTLLPPGEDTTWFSYRGLPLKWHLPVGVLYDLLVAGYERPWKIEVHHRFFPSAVLLPYFTSPSDSSTMTTEQKDEVDDADDENNLDSGESQRSIMSNENQRSPEWAVRSHWLSSLKESVFISCGSAVSVMEMDSRQSDVMWNAIADGNLERYSMAMSASNIQSAVSKSNEVFPVRLCMLDFGSSGGDNLNDVRAFKSARIDHWDSVR